MTRSARSATRSIEALREKLKHQVYWTDMIHICQAAEALLTELDRANLGRVEWKRQGSSYYTDHHVYVDPENPEKFGSIEYRNAGTLFFLEDT